ncbi:MAG: leucine--tRNA ligase, partial [Planctomycetota bacterium]
QMLKEGVAYRKMAKINWCPHDQTVLANEQVETHVKNGEEYQACFRCGTKVEPRNINSWFLRITDYADDLLAGLDDLGDDWPSKVVTQQRNWIGRSEGVEIDFASEIGNIRVFTTRADTTCGVTYLALAPEHPLVAEVLTKVEPAVADKIKVFVKEVATLSEIERSGGEDKDGINTGLSATNPLNGEKIPIFIASYVLMYGTGAVMAVPAHDERDFDFAMQYKLPAKQVIEAVDDTKVDTSSAAFTGHGKLIDSADYTGLSTADAIAKIAADLAAKDKGGLKVNFKIRDWGISRQRYWGCPIPVVHCPDCDIVPVPEDQLPIKLPSDVDFMPTGQSPLTLHSDFNKTTCPKCGREDAKRDTDTMDTFVDSSWYYLRYCDPDNSEKVFDKEKVAHWGSVDLYVGGREHAILHLIYARFWNRFCKKIGLVDFAEPFAKLYAHGLIQGESRRVVTDNMDRYVSESELKKMLTDGSVKDDQVLRRIEKMSKSKLNGADVTALLQEYGADAVRLTILFIGPSNADSVWEPTGIKGPYGFLRRWYELALGSSPLIEDLPELPENAAFSDNAKKLRMISHGLVAKVTGEFESRFAFNTAIAHAMILVNEIKTFIASEKLKGPVSGADDSTLSSRFVLREAFEFLVVTMAPFTPHTSEELHKALGHDSSVFEREWPVADKSLMVLDEIQIPVTVNGKVRAQIKVAKDADKQTLEEVALANEDVKKWIGDKPVRKVVAVPGRIVNVVAK